MKHPKISDLKVNAAGTRQMRAGALKADKVKITINVDSASLSLLRKRSLETGIPYQRLLNSMLKAGLGKDNSTESRLHKLENELQKLKRLMAA